MDNQDVSDHFSAYNFKLFYELMSIKIKEILLVSSAYDAYILEEDGALPSKIINEYRGLNLSQPPRVTKTSSAYKALDLLEQRRFDMVITMPHLDEMDAFSLGREIKKIKPDLPVILLAHSLRGIANDFDHNKNQEGIDNIFVWSGNAELLLALVKSAEDRLNVDYDTTRAAVRVLILVEDSPVYYSSFLPLIYKEIVRQTQAVLEVGINEEHMLLIMRARPKILLAKNYEEAVELYQKYRQYLFGVISDTRFPRNSKLDNEAGFFLLSKIKEENPDLPLLMLSSESQNEKKAKKIHATFLDKNSANLLSEIHNFFLHHLGFGEFIFRMADGCEVGRASDMRELEIILPSIPDESISYHAENNHFSRWIMARSEIGLARKFSQKSASEFRNPDEIRQYIISNLHALRKGRQRGIVAHFRHQHFDPDIVDFVKIGNGSLGGKGRGIAFMANMLVDSPHIYEKHSDITIQIPKTLVITSSGFESFVSKNKLQHYADEEYVDKEVEEAFLNADMPGWIIKELESYLTKVKYPLSVRSSSLLEDAQFQPYAGLYQTYMIPNNHAHLYERLQHLIIAIKLVYASTYYEAPKAFSRNTLNKTHDEAMAVIIQQLTGQEYGNYFYPAISGVALSHNYYPFSYMKPEEGIAHIALGLGKTVVEGEKSLRFSPRYPTMLPQFSTVEDILKNSQRFFYALKIKNYSEKLHFDKYSNLEKRNISDAADEYPVKALSSTYIFEDNRISDTGFINGPKIITFAQILKYNVFPLPQILDDLLKLGHKGMGCPVEIEFSVNLSSKKQHKGDFYFLQMRPMVVGEGRHEIQITNEEIDKAFCYSQEVLGNGLNETMADIVYVKPEDFKLDAMIHMVEEIDQINKFLIKENRFYLLIGPGRWGSADRWLGVPVQWNHISHVGAIIELRNEKLKADSSQGSHFFQNITSLSIPYITITENSSKCKFDWQWISSLSKVQEKKYVKHVRLEKPMILKIDGKNSQGVILSGYKR